MMKSLGWHTAPLLMLLIGWYLLHQPLVGHAGEFRSNNPLNQPGKVYWCPDRTSDKISATADGDCAVHDAERDRKSRNGTADREEDVQQDLNKELPKSLKFRTKPSKFTKDIGRSSTVASLTSIRWKNRRAPGPCQPYSHVGATEGHLQQRRLVEIDRVGSTAAPENLLKLGTFARQWTLSEIVGTVARARDDLHKIEAKLTDIIGRMENSTH
ncbi:MAG: hypothetical protein U0231_09435 [Nitrospiraceae bacterium]